jgi:hypothetical protein
MAGQRESGECHAERDQRVLVAYMARYPGGDAIKTLERHVQPLQHDEGPSRDP